MKINVNLAKKYIKKNKGLNHAKIDIIPTNTVKNTKPNCFVFVIDKSGSMDAPFGKSHDNEFISRLTCAKNSIFKFLDKLKPEDKIAIISFSDYAIIEQGLTSISKDNIDEIKKNIYNIKTDGCTNIEDGLIKSLNILKEVDSNKYSSKIILLSDGEANIGISTAEGLGKIAGAVFENNIIVSTMGIGLNYNSEIMGAISTKGNGGMHHINSFESFEDILTEEFESTANIIATNLKLIISNFGLIQICKNLNEYNQIDIEGNIEIELGDIVRAKSLALEFRNDLEVENQKVKLCLSYMDIEGNIRTIETVINLIISDNEDNSDNEEVLKYIKEILSATNLTRASGMYDSGNIDRSVLSMRSYTNTLNMLSENYKTCDFSDSLKESANLTSLFESNALSKNDAKMLYSKSIKKRRD